MVKQIKKDKYESIGEAIGVLIILSIISIVIKLIL
jgi:hypothetical protein